MSDPSLSMSDISNLCHLSFIISMSKGLLVLLIFSRNQPLVLGFPAGSDTKESACNAGDLCSIPGLGRSPGEQRGNPLQFTSLENPMDRGAWQALLHFQPQSFLDGKFFESFFNPFGLFGL